MLGLALYGCPTARSIHGATSPARPARLIILVYVEFAIAPTRSVGPSRERPRQHFGKIIRARPFAGCYELHVPAWTAEETRRNDLLPMRFRLTLQLDPSSKGRGFVARSLDSRTHYVMTSSWHIDSDGALALGWGTGYVGYRIHLTGSAQVLSGTAYYWTDTDPYPPKNARSFMKVVAHRTECKDSTN
jgi:hypothetical protein